MVISTTESGFPLPAGTYTYDAGLQRYSNNPGSPGSSYHIQKRNGKWCYYYGNVTGSGPHGRGRVRFRPGQIIVFYEQWEVRPIGGPFGDNGAHEASTGFFPTLFFQMPTFGAPTGGSGTRSITYPAGFSDPFIYGPKIQTIPSPKVFNGGSLIPGYGNLTSPFTGGGFSRVGATGAGFAMTAEEYYTAIFPPWERYGTTVFNTSGGPVTPPSNEALEILPSRIGFRISITGSPPYKWGKYKGNIVLAHPTDSDKNIGWPISANITADGIYVITREEDSIYGDVTDSIFTEVQDVSTLLVPEEDRDGLVVSDLENYPATSFNISAYVYFYPVREPGDEFIYPGDIVPATIPITLELEEDATGLNAYMDFSIMPVQGVEDTEDPFTPNTPTGSGPGGSNNSDDGLPPPPGGGGMISTDPGAPGFNPGPTPAPLPPLPFWWAFPTSDLLSFGEVCNGGIANLPVSIENLGNQPFMLVDAIIDADAGATFTLPTLNSTPVPENMISTFDLYYEPTAIGPHTATIDLLVSKVLSVSGITIDGTTATVTTTANHTHLIGDEVVFSGTNLPSDTKLTITAVTSNTVTVDITGFVVAPQSAGGFMSGDSLPNVVITVTAEGGDCIPTTTAIRTLRLDGDIIGSGNLAFGERGIGFNSTKILKVTNTGNAPITVGPGERSSGSDKFIFEAQQFTINPRTFREFEVTFNPSEISPVNAIMRIPSNATNIDPDGHAYFLVTGSGRVVGDPNEIVRAILINGTLAFGDVLVGNTIDRLVTITNIGDTDVLLNSITVPLPFKLSTESPMFTLETADDGTTTLRLVDEELVLAPLETTPPITVTFAPISGGIFDETFEVEVETNFGEKTLQATGRSATDFDDPEIDDGDDGDDPDLNPPPDPPTPGDQALDGVGNACIQRECELDYLYEHKSNRPS